MKTLTILYFTVPCFVPCGKPHAIIRLMQSLTLTVLIPTFKRPADLNRCLDALKKQDRLPDQVVITVRDIDTETTTFLDHYDAAPLAITRVTVNEPGVIAAMNAGLTQVTGEITVLTDDDTAGYPDWLQRIEAHFLADPKVGGVGGRDHQAIHPGAEPVVGIVQYMGRIVGNHHLGVGPARPVDILKGANSAYRTEPLQKIGFDTRLLGGGAQVNWELGLGLAFQRAGWKLIYDPEVQLDHYVAVRHDDDQFHRGGAYNPTTHEQAIYNETIFLWEDFSAPRKLAFLVWFLLVGTRSEPGVVQVVRLILQRNLPALRRIRPTLRGRFRAIRSAGKP